MPRLGGQGLLHSESEDLPPRGPGKLSPEEALWGFPELAGFLFPVTLAELPDLLCACGCRCLGPCLSERTVSELLSRCSWEVLAASLVFAELGADSSVPCLLLLPLPWPARGSGIGVPSRQPCPRIKTQSWVSGLTLDPLLPISGRLTPLFTFSVPTPHLAL